MSIIKGYWALLGSMAQGTRIDLAANMANLNIVLDYEDHDDTRISGETRIGGLGMRADQVGFGGIMEQPVEPPLWADKGREVVMVVNEQGTPKLTQANPTGAHIARGEVSKIGGLVAGAVGARRDFAVELTGARVSLARDGEILALYSNIAATQTTTPVVLADVTDDEEVVVAVWWDLPNAGAATGCTFALKRHAAAETFASAGAAELVAATELIDGGKNFRLFTVPGASAAGDTRYSARLVPTGGSLTVGAAIGIMPRGS